MPRFLLPFLRYGSRLITTGTFGAIFIFKGMITLRDNQVQPHKIAVAFFEKIKGVKPSIIVAPTAFGKSVLIAKTAADIKDKLLILQPTKELLDQNYAKYLACGEYAEIYSASFGKKNIGDTTFATIGSIKNLGSTFKEMGFTKMIIDEAHLYPRNSDSMIGKFLEESGITHVLGLTATPFKLQQNYDEFSNVYSKFVMLTSASKKGNFYKEIIYVSQVQEMVELGFWSKLIYEKANTETYELQWNSQLSDYTEASIKKAFKACNVHEKITTAIRENSDRKKIIIFVPSVDEAISLANVTPNAAAVWGNMDKNKRDYIVNDFKSGSLRVVFNVNVLSVGFDSPNIDWIILGRDFGSLAQYYQIVGRGTRILPTKEDCLITDFGHNIERFGKVEELRFEKVKTTWKLYGEGGKLLTGLPVHEIGSIVKQAEPEVSEQPIQETPVGEMLFTFGKHKGVPIKDIPNGYLNWCLENVTWNKWNMEIKVEIERFLKKDLVIS